MQFLSSPLSTTPFAGITQMPFTELQGLENFAESGADQGSLFALILGQLNVEQPVATPVVATAGPVIAQVATEIAATDLPPTGKPLPLVLPETTAQTLPALTAAEVATPASTPGEALLPLPVLPQALKQTETPRPAPVSTAHMPGTTPTQMPAPASTPRLTAEPLPQQPFVPGRNASVEHAASPPELSTPSKPFVAELPENLVLPQQNNTTTSNFSVAASPLLNASPAPGAPTANTPPQHAYTLNQPVADPQWGNELGRRLIWMNENGIGRAELRMNPPELGPVEVRIVVSNDDARVAFQVQHGATREALEHAMPRLREMFASQGLNLSDANVSEQSAQGQPQAGQSGPDADTHNPEGSFEQLAGELTDAPDRVRTTSINGLIDTYV